MDRSPIVCAANHKHKCVTRKRGNLTVLTQCLTLAIGRVAVATLASSTAAVTTKSDQGLSMALTGGVTGGLET